MEIEDLKFNIEMAYPLIRLISFIEDRYIIGTNSNNKLIIIDTKIDKCIKSLDLKKFEIVLWEIFSVFKSENDSFQALYTKKGNSIHLINLSTKEVKNIFESNGTLKILWIDPDEQK